jgi:hypothetical protein
VSKPKKYKLADYPGGWGWPANSRKAHYFHDGFRSLCMKWMYSGQVEQGKDESIDNCAECMKRLAVLRKIEVKP